MHGIKQTKKSTVNIVRSTEQVGFQMFTKDSTVMSGWGSKRKLSETN